MYRYSAVLFVFFFVFFFKDSLFVFPLDHTDRLVVSNRHAPVVVSSRHVLLRRIPPRLLLPCSSSSFTLCFVRGSTPSKRPDLIPRVTLTLEPTDRPERFSPVHLKRSTLYRRMRTCSLRSDFVQRFIRGTTRPTRRQCCGLRCPESKIHWKSYSIPCLFVSCRPVSRGIELGALSR